MQPIVRRAVGGREGPTALFAAETSSSALRGDVEGVADDVALAELSILAAIGVGTGASRLLAPLHTCLLPENEQEIEVESCVAGLLEESNNTSLKKHQKTTV